MKSAAEYNFPETVRTWTDFLKVPFSSQSTYELQRVHHEVGASCTRLT